MSPRVSVVLPVYNVEPYIEATIDSILKQTFTDFELLVLDDCSTDGTAARVRAIRDPRIRFIQNSHNLGRAGTDNAALEYVRGKYIAKMDGDDLCHPERLAQQIQYLDQHPEVNMVGSWLQNFGASSYLHRYPEKPEDLRVLTLFTLPGGNNCFMLRTSLLREDGMHYDANLRQTEDYDFCARYLDKLVIATIPKPLVLYRVLPRAHKQPILNIRAAVSKQVQAQIFDSWRLPVSDRELYIHSVISLLDQSSNDISLQEIESWLLKLQHHNEQYPRFDPVALERGLGERWFEACYRYAQPRLSDIRRYYQSPLAIWANASNRQQAKLWAKSLLRLF